MSGHPIRRGCFEPLLPDIVRRVSPCNVYRDLRDNETSEAYVARLAVELDDKFREVGPDTIIGFVAEPVSGATLGCMPAAEGYFAAMKAVCDKYDALFILDEIMCGMGRTGTLHAWEQEDVVPDISVVGKGLSGGFQPLAAVLMGKRVVDVLSDENGVFHHGQTYEAFPLACAAALCVQKIIQEENLLENVRKQGTYLERLLKEGLGDHPNVGDIRGRGAFWGIEFVEDKKTKEPFAPSVEVAPRMHDLGMLAPYHMAVYAGQGTMDGVKGDHILLAPAYNLTRDDMKEIADKLIGMVNQFFAEL